MKIRKDPVFNIINKHRRMTNIQKEYGCNTFKSSGYTWREQMKKEILERPKTVRINFSDRELSNKFLYVVYRALRILHVSIWFYSLPFLFVLTMYFWPNYQEY